MTTYVVPALNGVDFALASFSPGNVANHSVAVSSYSVPALSAVDFALSAYTRPVFIRLDFEIGDQTGVVTGSVAKNLGTLTAQGVVLIDVAGMGASTLGALTGSSVGAIVVDGVLSSVFGELSCQIAGSIDPAEISGSFDQTLGALGLISAGDISGEGVIDETFTTGGAYWLPHRPVSVVPKPDLRALRRRREEDVIAAMASH